MGGIPHMNSLREDWINQENRIIRKLSAKGMINVYTELPVAAAKGQTGKLR